MKDLAKIAPSVCIVIRYATLLPNAGKMHPHLNTHKKDNKNTALLVTEPEENDVICLMAKHQDPQIPEKSGDSFIDSGCSNHMTYDQFIFSAYTKVELSMVKLGNQATSAIVGKVTCY